jgi:hypothetical protein
MMMQRNGKKTTTINIDKINGIENENDMDGYVITDEMKVRLVESLKPFTSFGIANSIQGLSLPIAGIQESIKIATSQLPDIVLSRTNSIQSFIQNASSNIKSFYTPEMHEAMRLFGERMREKQAIEVDRYNNNTHVGMKIKCGFDYLLLTEKQKSDFFIFVILNFDREDERWQFPIIGFIESITDREWQDWGKKYYTLQDKISDDGVEDFKKQLSTPPAPKVEDKIKGKAGAPKKKPNEWHDKICKEYLRLTVTNPTTISISLAKGRLIKTTYKDFFKNYSTYKSKMARLNTILRTQSNNN